MERSRFLVAGGISSDYAARVAKAAPIATGFLVMVSIMVTPSVGSAPGRGLAVLPLARAPMTVPTPRSEPRYSGHGHDGDFHELLFDEVEAVWPRSVPRLLPLDLVGRPMLARLSDA